MTSKSDVIIELREMAGNDSQPDCDIATLNRAADDLERYRKVMTLAADIIDRHLNTQREKVTDASAILRDALGW